MFIWFLVYLCFLCTNNIKNYTVICVIVSCYLQHVGQTSIIPNEKFTQFATLFFSSWNNTCFHEKNLEENQMSNLEHPNDIPVHWLLHRNLYNGLHPGRLTWNIQTTHFERNMIFATSRRLCSSRSSSRVYEIFSKCNWVGFHPHIWQQISKVLGTHVLHPMYCRKLQNPGFFFTPPQSISENMTIRA